MISVNFPLALLTGYCFTPSAMTGGFAERGGIRLIGSEAHIRVVAMLIPRLTFLFGLLAAVLASQLPEFAQQYRQRLGGAIDELSREVVQFGAEAKAERLTPDSAIERLRHNADVLAQKRAIDMNETMARLTRLERQRDSFVDAGPLTRIAVLARDFDPAIASRAYQSFEPAVPTTPEGFVSAVVGFFLGGGLLRLLGLPFRRRTEEPDDTVAMRDPAFEVEHAQSIRLRQRMNRYTLPPGRG